MKYLFHRLTALLLAVLLLCGAGGILSYAAQITLPDPACVLGTDPTDMLAAGGRRVTAGERLLYVDEEDGCVYDAEDPKTPVMEGPAALLNYGEGVLYYARIEKGSFDLCAYELSGGKQSVLLAGFSGVPGQLYLVDGQYLDFSCGNAIWQLTLETGEYRLIDYVEGLWSFVPTGCGLICATGSLFDYNLYAGGKLLAEHVDDYTVHYDIGRGLVVFTELGESWQMDLAQAMAGEARPSAYTGYENAYTPLAAREELSPQEAAKAEEAEVLRLQRELAEVLARPENQTGNAAPQAAPADPADVNPEDPQRPDPEPEEPSEPVEEPTEPVEEPSEPVEEPTEPVEEPTEPAPTEPAPTEPAPSEPAPTEPAPTEPAPTEPTPTEPAPTEPAPTESQPLPAEPLPTEPPADEPKAPTATGAASFGETVDPVEPPVYPTAVFSGGALRPTLSTNQINIVKRARQMLNVQWTPRKNVGGWGYYDSSYSLRILYQAGKTYTGLPYGQVVDTCYIPWGASFSYFVNAVKDSGSKMYTSRSSYSRGSQYYGTDCSAFASWAWNATNRKACYYGTYVGRSYKVIQVGDSVCSNYHAMLVTDVSYNSDGSIAMVEISQANPTTSYTGCCYATRYNGQSELESMNRSLFVNGSYSVYRRNPQERPGNFNGSSVSYSHDCAVPLAGDVCPLCGVGEGGEDDPYAGLYAARGVDVSEHQGTVDWKAAASQADFALVRIGYTGNSLGGIYKDSQADANIAGCKANNIPFGLYYYAGATTPEKAREEANKVLEYIGMSNLSALSLPVFYDVEETRNILNTGVVTDTDLLSIITAFCGTLEDCGIRTGVYASTSVWNSRMNSGSYDRWAKWAAQWETNSLTTLRGAHVWQYDSQGQLPGVAGDVDVDYWLGKVGETGQAFNAVIEPPSCVENGTLSCSGVTKSQSVQLPIRPLGHSYVNGVCVRCTSNESVFDRFKDVVPGKWYSDAVGWAVSRGITTGTSADTFGTMEPCTRGQIMTFLWRLAGSPMAKNRVSPFTDVKEGKYYYDAVLWAVENGITTGTTATTFSPNKQCTRAQAVAFLWRFGGGETPNLKENPFRDLSPDSPFYDPILWAYENHITSGTSEGVFSPRKICNRATIVKLLLTASKLLAPDEE